MKYNVTILSGSIIILITLLSFNKGLAKLHTGNLHINSEELTENIGVKDKAMYNSTLSCSDQVNIPDVNFKNELLALGVDTNNDNIICRSEAEDFTDALFLIGLNISDLTGIEAFVSITELYCSHNQLTSLDVSNNLQLRKLSCNNNQIESIDISMNTEIIRLACENNELTSLNVANGNNVNMTAMRTHNNVNLNCIQHDANFDPNTSTSWLKDNTANWNTNCGMATEEVYLKKQINIYPNPVKDILNISTLNSVKKMSIYDSSGKLVLESKETKIPIHNLKKGLFIISVEFGNGKTVRDKFIKK